MIAEHMQSKWYDTFAEVERDLRDADFNGMDWQLDTPPQEHNKLYHLIASVHICIEQRFAIIKAWSAAKNKLQVLPVHCEDLLHMHNQIWTIIAVLANDYQ